MVVAILTKEKLRAEVSNFYYSISSEENSMKVIFYTMQGNSNKTRFPIAINFDKWIVCFPVLSDCSSMLKRVDCDVIATLLYGDYVQAANIDFSFDFQLLLPKWLTLIVLNVLFQEPKRLTMCFSLNMHGITACFESY